jgi:outer membrane receptor protein involved in Fe transport
MKMKCTMAILATSASALALLASPALAQQSDGRALEEIVVTARKQTETLQNVPVAVSVVSAAQLAKNNATNLEKIAEITPTVFAGQIISGTGAVLSIRGIGSSPSDSGIDSSVAVDIDGVQLSRGRIITESYFDLRQVEVLEGPQALFFGKNSPAGVISIHSADPTPTFEAYVRGGYEFNAREKFGEGAVSGPITDTLQGRIAMRVSGSDGWMKNVATSVPYPNLLGIPFPNNNAPVFTVPGDSRAPGGTDVALRLSLKWTPTDDFNAMLKVTGNVMNLNGANGNQENFCVNPIFPVPTLVGYPSFQTDCNADQTRALANLPPVFATNYPYVEGGKNYYKSQNLLSSLVLNKSLDKLDITSTTGYYYQLTSDGNNSDLSEYPLVWDVERETYRLITQEVRATTKFDAPLNVMGGVYYEHFSRPRFNSPFLLYTGLDPLVNNFTNNSQHIDNEGHTISLFGQVRWTILPSLELDAGARWTHETKTAAITQLSVNPINVLGPLHPIGSTISGEYNSNNVSPEATLTWHINPRQMVYGAFKTGYKSGGIANTAVISADTSIDDLRFGAEKSKGGEIGYKAELLDRTLRLNLTAYLYNFTNLQVSVFNPPTISYLLRNAAAARTQGVEAQAVWRATADLTLNATAAYTDAHYQSFPGAQCYTGQQETGPMGGCFNGVQDLSGKRLLRAPRYAFNFGGDYLLELGPDWRLDLAADASYNSSYVVDETQNPLGVQDAFWKMNASVKLSPTNGHYAISLIARDLNNAYYRIYQSDNSASPYAFTGYFNRPREIVLQAEYHF